MATDADHHAWCLVCHEAWRGSRPVYDMVLCGTRGCPAGFCARCLATTLFAYLAHAPPLCPCCTQRMSDEATVLAMQRWHNRQVGAHET
jgi:hypothetical protein